MKLWTKICTLFTKRRLEREMAKEMQAHLDGLTERNIAKGMSPKEARYAAHRAFGGVEQIKERARDERVFFWMERMCKDLGFAVRSLRRSKSFSMAVIATLALGIGVNTTAFTVLNRLMLQSLPFDDPVSVVKIISNSVRFGTMGIAPADYHDIKAQNTAFVDMAAYQQWRRLNYAESGKAPILVSAISMSANFFSVLGVSPALGRLPTDKESQEMASVCLISDAFWRQHFNANPNVLGQPIRLDSRSSTVIGVMPPSLDDPALFLNRPSIFYLNLVNESRADRRVGWLSVVARLKPGVSLKQAQAGLTVVAEGLAHEYPETNQDRDIVVIPYPRSQLEGVDLQLTWMPLALSGLVLLIACINIASLQLVRTTRRSREFAIRLSLGCPRSRIIGMLLLESIFLSVLGGALGFTLSAWTNVFAEQFFKMDMPLNLRVMAYTFVLSLVTGVLSGIVPALLTFRADVGDALKSGGAGATSDRSRHWLRQSLVVVELAMALTLLSGASFFVIGIHRLTHRDLGWDASHQIIAQVSLDHEQYGGDKNRDKVIAFANLALEKLISLPGVQSAAISDGSPAWGSSMTSYRVEGRQPPEKGQEPRVGSYTVSPRWFEVYGIQLIEGRLFSNADHADSAPVAIVTASMARKLWPGESAIGKRISQADIIPPTGGHKNLVWAEIVGVIRDFKGEGEFNNPVINNEKFIRPWVQVRNGIVFSVRTVGPPESLKESVRKAFGVLQPDRALDSLFTIDETTTQTYGYYTFVRRILVQIASLGLLLSAVGIYGVVAYLATERTREIGVRMALGAQPKDVLWLFIRNGLVLACTGATIGLVGAFALVSMLERLLPVLPGKSLLVVAGAGIALIGVAILACWLPARQAAKVNPMEALRHE